MAVSVGRPTKLKDTSEQIANCDSFSSACFLIGLFSDSNGGRSRLGPLSRSRGNLEPWCCCCFRGNCGLLVLQFSVVQLCKCILPPCPLNGTALGTEWRSCFGLPGTRWRALQFLCENRQIKAVQNNWACFTAQVQPPEYLGGWTAPCHRSTAVLSTSFDIIQPAFCSIQQARSGPLVIRKGCS